MTSLGYMSVGAGGAKGWKNSGVKWTGSISAIAMIEVADHRKNPKLITGGESETGVNVAMDPSMVVTRFLFFYPNGPTFQPPPAPVVYPFSPWGSPIPPAYGPIAEKIKTSDFMFLDGDKDDEDEQLLQ